MKLQNAIKNLTLIVSEQRWLISAIEYLNSWLKYKSKNKVSRTIEVKEELWDREQNKEKKRQRSHKL